MATRQIEIDDEWISISAEQSHTDKGTQPDEDIVQQNTSTPELDPVFAVQMYQLMALRYILQMLGQIHSDDCIPCNTIEERKTLYSKE